MACDAGLGSVWEKEKVRTCSSGELTAASLHIRSGMLDEERVRRKETKTSPHAVASGVHRSAQLALRSVGEYIALVSEVCGTPPNTARSPEIRRRPWFRAAVKGISNVQKRKLGEDARTTSERVVGRCMNIH